MQKQNLPIGVFDSGVGGVSVLRELVRLLPNEDFLYLGDSQNAPYGTKSYEEIFVYAENCAEYLISKGVKALVVACNTATSVCIEDLRGKYSALMPIVGIEPALKPAVTACDNPTVVVMATPLTLREKKFAALCGNYESCARIIPLPCPGLMELIEQGHTGDDVVRDFIEQSFGDKGISSPDAVVLGCTHYPFVKGVISELFPGAKIYDGGVGTAMQLRRLLEADNLLSTREEPGKVVFENTSGNPDFNILAEKLMNM